jgi:hypothetical protein
MDRAALIAVHAPAQLLLVLPLLFLTATCYLTVLTPSMTSMLPPPASCRSLARAERLALCTQLWR